MAKNFKKSVAGKIMAGIGFAILFLNESIQGLSILGIINLSVRQSQYLAIAFLIIGLWWSFTE